jgi:hypothetical protein
MKKMLSMLLIGAAITLGLAGCAQTPPAVPANSTNMAPATSTSGVETATTTSAVRISRIQAGGAEGMKQSRLYLVVTKRELHEIEGIARRISDRVGAIKTDLLPEMKGFTMRTPGSVLVSDMLRDPDVKFVVFEDRYYTPAAIQSKGASASDKKKTSVAPTKSKSTAKSKTAAKKTTSKTAKNKAKSQKNTKTKKKEK